MQHEAHASYQDTAIAIFWHIVKKGVTILTSATAICFGNEMQFHALLCG